MSYEKVKDLEEYKGWIRHHMRESGINEDDISNIVTSTEGHSIIKQCYKSGFHPTCAMDDILKDAPDYIIDQMMEAVS